MRLLTKIALIILTGVVIMTTGGVIFVFTSTKSALQTSVTEKQAELGRQTMDRIDRVLFGYYIGIQNIAEEESIERTLSGAVTDKRVIERRIKELPFLTGPWDVLSIVDTNGVAVVSNVAAEVGEDLKKDPGNFIALKSALAGNVYHSDFVFSEETERPTMIFAAPVRDQEKPDQPIVGVILGHMAWPVVNDLINSFDPVREFDLYMPDGTLIATNQENSTKLFVKNEEIARSIAASRSANASTPAQHQGVEKETESGFEALITESPSTGYLGYKGHQWSLFIETPTALAFAPAANTARNIVFFLVPISLFTGIVVLLLLYLFLIRPLVGFTEVTKIIAGGDLTKRAEVHSKDEMGELAASFNVMTARLQESHASLEGKVQERTAELNQKIGELGKMNKFMVNRELKMVELKKEIAELRSGKSPRSS
ncbi:MAG: HAMP domain-containing protein [Candidatus Magasanikbacteria bacterium]|nr:HAMP domain-containing protein [Candidatus Magasanikbacteria bacterium]